MFFTQLTQVIYVFYSADSGELCFPMLAVEIHI